MSRPFESIRVNGNIHIFHMLYINAVCISCWRVQPPDCATLAVNACALSLNADFKRLYGETTSL